MTLHIRQVTPQRLLDTITEALLLDDRQGLAYSVVDTDIRTRSFSEEEWTDIVTTIRGELRYYHSTNNPKVYHRFLGNYMCPSRPINLENLGLGRFIEESDGSLRKLKRCKRCKDK